jgi:hypothetical protein
MATVLDAARKWRDELHDYIIPGADGEGEATAYTAQADAISAALDALQPIHAYFTGDEDGPDHFGIIYDDEDEAMEAAFENGQHVWRVPLVPDWAAATLVGGGDDDDTE